MSENILGAPFIRQLGETAAIMYKMGWDERNSGNISLLINEEEAARYVDFSAVLREYPLELGEKEREMLKNRFILLTGAGKYFRNIEKDPEENLGLVRISEDGGKAELLWGFARGARPTSELSAHLLSHAARLSRDSENRVIMHSHPTYITAMSFVHELSEREFSRSLWKICTEAIMIFPDGVGVIPWEICGTRKIGEDTAEKMRDFRLVIWAKHGIYGAGRSLDEALGLIETAEKAAQLYMLTANFPNVSPLCDSELIALVRHIGADYRKDFF